MEATAESLWTIDRRRLALTEALRWAGTPHKNRVAIPGEGIDCVRFVLEVLTSANIIERPTLPYYDQNLGIFRTRNVIGDILNTFLHGQELAPPAVPEFGDIVICTCGRQSNHVGIYLDAFWHVQAKAVVAPAGWDRWRPHVESVFRIAATGYKQPPQKLTWEAIQSGHTGPHVQ